MLLGYQKTIEDAFALMAKDILVWLDCFMYYTSIVGSVAPGRIAGLMRYSRIVMWIYKESQDVTSWWRYDFRLPTPLQNVAKLKPKVICHAKIIKLL